MKILAVAFAYNERKYIDQMVRYYRAQGCDLFILDNHSTDGTAEYLIENEVATAVLPTGGQFHLKKLQAGLMLAIRELKPDWVIYTGIDIYYSFDLTIRETIEKADVDGFNMIGVQHYNIYNTGEQRGGEFQHTYFHGRRGNKLYMIAKYEEPFGFEADSIQRKSKKITVLPGILVNYGNCKPKAERMDTYLRRKKAWDHGLDRNYGVHYLEGIERNWTWTKEEMTDLRTTEYHKYIQKL